MDQRTILIGVDHTPTYLNEVLSFLKKQDVLEKKVLIETPSYPLPSKYYKRNPAYCDFYDGIYQYLHRKKACIIHGDNKVLIEKAYEKMFGLWDSYIPFSNDWKRQYEKIVCEERDPHFYEMYRKSNPEIIIIDSLHANYLRKRIRCEYLRIPKDN